MSHLFDLISDEATDTVGYFIENDVLIRKWRDRRVLADCVDPCVQVVVPRLLRYNLLEICHRIPAAGHLGIRKSLARLRLNFFWPGMVKAVKWFIRTCPKCQVSGKDSKPQIAPLQSLPILSHVMQRVCIDAVGPLPSCKGYRFILTMIYCCSHYPFAIPPKRHRAKDIADALISVFTQFGFASEILSDNAPEYNGKPFKILTEIFHIKHVRISPYHEMGNQIERLHLTLKRMLRCAIDKSPEKLVDILPLVMFAYCEVPNESTGFISIELMFGSVARGPLTLIKEAWTGTESINCSKRNVVEYL